MATKPRVVVVGGGFIGARVARDLKLTKACSVTLVDSKEYFELTWAALRAMVEPACGARITWLHHDYLQGRAAVVVGSVASVGKQALQLTDGRTVPYDYLVLAPGMGGTTGRPSHPTLAERRAFYFAEAERIGHAKSVLIVGGGPVGSELAGEIITEFPGKKVTLVHPGKALMDAGMEGAAFAGPFSAKLTAQIKSMGVTVLTGTRVARNPDGTFAPTTEAGVPMDADIVFNCTGATPNTGFLAASAGGDLAIRLTPAGFIVVDRSLRVAGASNVFACGDAADTGAMKSGYASRSQADVVVKNLLAAIAKRPAAAVLAKSPIMMFVSTGHNGGVGLLPICGGCVVGSGMVAGAKSKGLFIDVMRKDFGLAK